MNIAILGWKQQTALDVPSHVETRMQHALGRFAKRIQRLTVRLKDVNGPKGGQDKLCQIQLSLEGGGQLVVEKRASGWLDVVDTAAASAGHAVARILEKAKFSRRTSIRRMTTIDAKAEDVREL